MSQALYGHGFYPEGIVGPLIFFWGVRWIMDNPPSDGYWIGHVWATAALWVRWLLHRRHG